MEDLFLSVSLCLSNEVSKQGKMAQAERRWKKCPWKGSDCQLAEACLDSVLMLAVLVVF